MAMQNMKKWKIEKNEYIWLTYENLKTKDFLK